MSLRHVLGGLVMCCGVVVAVATHATNGPSVNHAVRRWALERAAGVAERDLEPDPGAGLELDRVVGTYSAGLGLFTVAPGPDEGTVVVTTAPHADVDWQPPADAPFTLAPALADHLVGVDGPQPRRTVRVGLDGDGPADWVQLGLRRALRVAEADEP